MRRRTRTAVPEAPVPGLISADELASGHALSTENQPYLKRLLRIVRDETKQITLVLGAGVSIDSGLPNWTGLLKFMLEQIRDDEMRRLATADTSTDPARKAEYIQRLATWKSNRSTLEIVRDGLYPDAVDPQPGALANALARFVGTEPERFTVLTTNFDRIFEAALEANARVRHGHQSKTAVRAVSLGLNDATSGEMSLGCDELTFRVTHLHGMVQRNNDRHLEPVILTESEFLREGPRVRSIISERLRVSTVIFVGLSLTDPNLVGPLWDLAHEGSSSVAREHFVLTVVPDIHLDDEDDQSQDATAVARQFHDVCRYELEKASYLDTNLRLRPVFLKSFSQLIQLANDMGLASAEPSLYSRRPPKGTKSIRYGTRLNKALADVYKQVGCGPRDEVPLGEAADVLSRRLRDALSAPDGPMPALKELRTRLARQGKAIPGLGEEHLGLGLWLRVRGKQGQPAPYTIRLMGTSVGTPHDAWSFDHQVEVNGRSDLIAAKCLYRGRTEVGGVKPTDKSSLWKGILATPLTIYGAGVGVSVSGSVSDMLDRVTVGVATLNTTANVDEHKLPRSLISWADEVGELAAIAEAVSDVVTAIITSPFKPSGA